jgi:hypothetical protein
MITDSSNVSSQTKANMILVCDQAFEHILKYYSGVNCILDEYEMTMKL